MNDALAMVIQSAGIYCERIIKGPSLAEHEVLMYIEMCNYIKAYCKLQTVFVDSHMPEARRQKIEKFREYKEWLCHHERIIKENRKSSQGNEDSDSGDGSPVEAV